MQFLRFKKRVDRSYEINNIKIPLKTLVNHLKNEYLNYDKQKVFFRSR